MKCLGADFIIDFLSNDSGAVKKALELRNENLVTTPLQVFEVFHYLRKTGKGDEKTLGKVGDFFSNIEILELGHREAFKASELKAKASENKAQGNEEMTAGILLSYGCSHIITRQGENFVSAGIKMERY